MIRFPWLVTNRDGRTVTITHHPDDAPERRWRGQRVGTGARPPMVTYRASLPDLLTATNVQIDENLRQILVKVAEEER